MLQWAADRKKNVKWNKVNWNKFNQRFGIINFTLEATEGEILGKITAFPYFCNNYYVKINQRNEKQKCFSSIQFQTCDENNMYDN